MKPGYKGMQRIFKATEFSIQGLKAAWKNEAAFRQEVVLVLILVPFALLMSVPLLTKLILIGSLLLILIVELINSAIEAVVDRVGKEHHELSGQAKDIGSAAVLLTLILAVVTWLSVIINFIIQG
ncbi:MULTISPECIES: diacylglycerol kinase [Salinivibrio]|uniref:Diacylglycerol kinase n=1 Tax=Salinivibrio costicola subsp. alcaliphilus TaxID=272773 RepID=A0ABX3KTX6_SALCS|nr:MULTISPECIES: diacylglycerol kinase [Salinivibrio]OOF02157.1 diacylglycerol kinase [Salinivibrio sp. MA607]OOF35181.1 diacylglycerol kinase [Salinivibrio costicola subsp. alcaliphilus]